MLIAYLDPSSGSLVLQLLAGGLAGVVVLMRLASDKVKATLRGWVYRNKGNQ